MRLCIILVVCILTRLEGKVFYLTFLRTDEHKNGTTQQIFISSMVDCSVKIDYFGDRMEEVTLNSTNQWNYAKKIPSNINPPVDALSPAVIVVSSTADISVQATKELLGSGDGYLALPISPDSTEFYLASYSYNNLRPYQHSEYAIVSPFNNTAVTLFRFNGSTIITVSQITLRANTVYHGVAPAAVDFTGYYINSTLPIGVFSGHSCASVPILANDCDHLVEQLPPVSQWGMFFILGTFYGRSPAVGFIIRVIAHSSISVAYWSQTNGKLDFDVYKTTFLQKGEFDEAHSPAATDRLLVAIRCSAACLVVQYSLEVQPSDADMGINPGAFMVVVPSVEHYTSQSQFSTSGIYGGGHLTDAVAGITVITKASDIHKITLNGKILVNVEKHNQRIVSIRTFPAYSVITAPLAPGFQIVSSENEEVRFGVLVYGHGVEHKTSYGYLGGYHYDAVYGEKDEHPQNGSVVLKRLKTGGGSGEVAPQEDWNVLLVVTLVLTTVVVALALVGALYVSRNKVKWRPWSRNTNVEADGDEIPTETNDVTLKQMSQESETTATSPDTDFIPQTSGEEAPKEAADSKPRSKQKKLSEGFTQNAVRKPRRSDASKAADKTPQASTLRNSASIPETKPQTIPTFKAADEILEATSRTPAASKATTPAGSKAADEILEATSRTPAASKPTAPAASKPTDEIPLVRPWLPSFKAPDEIPRARLWPVPAPRAASDFQEAKPWILSTSKATDDIAKTRSRILSTSKVTDETPEAEFRTQDETPEERYQRPPTSTADDETAGARNQGLSKVTKRIAKPRPRKLSPSPAHKPTNKAAVAKVRRSLHSKPADGKLPSTDEASDARDKEPFGLEVADETYEAIQGRPPVSNAADEIPGAIPRKPSASKPVYVVIT